MSSAADVLEPVEPEAEPETQIRVLYDRILVRRLEPREQVGSIFIPDEHRTKTQEAIVLAVDPDGRFFNGVGFRPLKVQPGDRVCFSVHSGVEMSLTDGRKVFVIREDEVMGVLEQK